MNKRTRKNGETPLYVDVLTLADMLSVGRGTAIKIGNDANAVLHIGRRTLYRLSKIEEYLDGLTGKEEEKK